MVWERRVLYLQASSFVGVGDMKAADATCNVST